jgi:hypothetical protein
MMVIETIQGILRNIFLVPLVGDLRSRQIGVFIGSGLVVIVAVIMIDWIGPRSLSDLPLIGTLAGADPDV